MTSVYISSRFICIQRENASIDRLLLDIYMLATASSVYFMLQMKARHFTSFVERWCTNQLETICRYILVFYSNVMHHEQQKPSQPRLSSQSSSTTAWVYAGILRRCRSRTRFPSLGDMNRSILYKWQICVCSSEQTISQTIHKSQYFSADQQSSLHTLGDDVHYILHKCR